MGKKWNNNSASIEKLMCASDYSVHIIIMNHVTNRSHVEYKMGNVFTYVHQIFEDTKLYILFIGQAILKYTLYSMSTDIVSLRSNIILINIIFTACEINTHCSV